LAGYCEKIREEVYRHLLIIQNVETNLVMLTVSQIASVLAIIAMVIAALPNTFRIEPPPNFIAFVIQQAMGIAIVSIAVIFALRIRKRLPRILKPASDIIMFGDKSYKDYLDKLKVCCDKLESLQCTSEIDIFCLNLKKLKDLAEKI
jgi:hypothetical protein